MITDITKKEIKLRTRSQLGIKPEKVSYDELKSLPGNMAQLDVYRQHWEALSDFRDRFRTNTDYFRSRQLENIVENDNGVSMTEAEYISEQGKTPFVQNMIAPVMKSIEGLFRQDMGMSVVVSRKPNMAAVEKMLTNALQGALDINEVKEIDPITLAYFLLSGVPCQRIGFDWVDDLQRYDIVINYFDANYLFFNNDISDIRGHDLRLIGLIHDLTLDDIYVNFANSKEDKKRLKSIFYSTDRDGTPNYMNLTKDRVATLDFYVSQDTSKCRVIEAWEKKAIEVIKVHDELDGSDDIWDDTLENLNLVANARYEQYRAAGVPEEEIPRIHYQYTQGFKWFYKFMSPGGHILREGESPYNGGMHPFILTPHPLISGEIFGFVETLKYTQDQFNRMFTHMDFFMGTSAKNTLVIDEASLNGQNPEDIASDYRRVGGVLVLKLKDGAKPPFELRSLGMDRAVFEIIQMYTKLMQDISGVQPALQGQSAGSGVPASRFIAETQNSIINLRPILGFFESFRKKRDTKVLQMIMQFYKSKRYINSDSVFDPAMISVTMNDIDLVVAKGTDSPVFKAMNDEMLKDFTLQGLLPLKYFLKNTDYSFSKPILEDLENAEEQLRNGQNQGQMAAQQPQVS